jgi:hypothetical protein
MDRFKDYHSGRTLATVGSKRRVVKRAHKKLCDERLPTWPTSDPASRQGSCGSSGSVRGLARTPDDASHRERQSPASTRVAGSATERSSASEIAGPFSIGQYKVSER